MTWTSGVAGLFAALISAVSRRFTEALDFAECPMILKSKNVHKQVGVKAHLEEETKG
jgi:hypothetical protein